MPWDVPGEAAPPRLDKSLPAKHSHISFAKEKVVKSSMSITERSRIWESHGIRMELVGKRSLKQLKATQQPVKSTQP